MSYVLSTRTPRSLAAVALAAALAACGGGDDDDDVVAPPPGAPMTQADAEAWSRVGASGYLLVDVARSLLQRDAGDYASDDLPVGQQRYAVDCPNGGTMTVDYRKTRGGAVGDFVQIDYRDCIDGQTAQDGRRRMAAVGVDDSGVHFEERFSDYTLHMAGVADVELDSGSLRLTVPGGGAALKWRANDLRGDVEALSEQDRRAFAAGDVQVSGSGSVAASAQQTSSSFTLDMRHESGLALRSASRPEVVVSGGTSTGAVLLTAPNRAARVLNTLERTRTVVQLDARGTGQVDSSSVIDARLY